jgi:hypothetical protein
MRLYEVQFSKDELEQIREEIRRENPHLTEEQIDEILPAIALGAARLGGAAIKGVGALARGVGKVGSMVGRGIGKVASTAGGMAKQAGQMAVNKGKQMAVNKVKQTVSKNLSTGGRTTDSGAGQENDPAAEIDAMAQANSELQATYQAKVKEIEKSLGDMKKSLKL